MANSMEEQNREDSDIGLALTVDRPIEGKLEDRLGRAPSANRFAAAIAKWKGDDGLDLAVWVMG